MSLVSIAGRPRTGNERMNLVFHPTMATLIRKQGQGNMSQMVTFLILQGAKESLNLDGWSELEETIEQVKRGKKIDVAKLSGVSEVISSALEDGDWMGREEYSRPRTEPA